MELVNTQSLGHIHIRHTKYVIMVMHNKKRKERKVTREKNKSRARKCSRDENIRENLFVTKMQRIEKRRIASKLLRSGMKLITRKDDGELDFG